MFFVLHFIKHNKVATLSFMGICGFFLIALFAPYLMPYSYSETHPGFLKLPPYGIKGSHPMFLLGTDDLGRDVLSRLIYGTRISLGLGGAITLICFLVGNFWGLLSGYTGGKTDQWTLGILDIMMSLPGILLAILIAATLGAGLMSAALALTLINLPATVRISRAETLKEKSKSYVESLVSLGAHPLRILLKHIFPNCLSPMTVHGILIFSESVLGVAALGFLGLGVRPPLPEWGTLISDSRHLMVQAWWLVLLPGLCLFSVVLCLNFLGSSLRDALDPKFNERA